MSIAQSTTAELAGKIQETFSARGSVYGTPEENFGNTAAFWSAWIKARHGVSVTLDGHDVGQMCAMLKLARLAQSPTHADSALDAAVYIMLGHGCAVDAEQLMVAKENAA